MKILIVLKFTIWLYRLASMTSRLATSVVKSWHLKLKIVLFVWRFQFLQFEIFSIWLRGVIKKFSAWPSSVENKIKIVFATYSSNAQNTTCTIWLLGYKYFVHFSGCQLFAFDMEKKGVTQCNEMTILTDSFVPLHALLLWLRIEVVDALFVLNNELWNKCLLGHVRILREVLQKLVYHLVLASLTPIWQTVCSYAKMHKIFIAQKSCCAGCVLSLATIRNK